MICNPATPSCHLGSCSCCPRVDNLKTSLMSLLDDKFIESIVYQQWTSVDRSTLETVSQPADEFAESLCSELDTLLTHSFIAKQLTSFYSETKSSPPPGFFVVSADFSENYAFVLQDEAQGSHWNNAQATVHPFVIYSIDSGSTNHVSEIWQSKNKALSKKCALLVKKWKAGKFERDIFAIPLYLVIPNSNLESSLNFLKTFVSTYRISFSTDTIFFRSPCAERGWKLDEGRSKCNIGT